MTATDEVLLRQWYQAFPPFTVGGSLYAVPSPQRATAAAALAENRCRVHADVIVDLSGRHRGVTWDELSDVRLAAPSARLDLHVIVPAGLPSRLASRLVAEVADAATELGAEAVTLDAGQLGRHGAVLDRLRADGVEVWVELPPDAPARELPGGVDGAIVMFITPGTQDLADPELLEKVTRLGARTPVAVDGGVTEELAAQCVEQGARYVVAGRSLLTAAQGGPDAVSTQDSP